ncbi:hypothetical protein G436_3205 [Leptospira interrogans serovar Hardjo str. Norma]|uniref:Uncharacterized protein n=1 Tax=Leptospira interrogans serovar Hardjo str. Norma TaxID=1279460 RepID=A0A0M4MW62_LEPIR|nr:hypothetical protein G436_3205 [Leptospira interrogans serovar Hardjo str. Norma]
MKDISNTVSRYSSAGEGNPALIGDIHEYFVFRIYLSPIFILQI